MIVLRDAVIITAACAAVAFTVNAVRADGLPVVPKKAYDLFVPCPEPSGEVTRIYPPGIARLGRQGSLLVIDARERQEYQAWHHPGAVSIPFDYLMPVCKERLREVTASGAASVAVYGDGLDPDSGRELAKELAGSGVRNVHYVEGGAPALLLKGGREP